jgi:hypothetical protein
MLVVAATHAAVHRDGLEPTVEPVRNVIISLVQSRLASLSHQDII